MPNYDINSIRVNSTKIEGSNVTNFEIVKKIGKGSFSSVYQVDINGKHYALKVTNKNDKSVETEVRILNLLKHDHVIKMIHYEHDKAHNNTKILTEYLENFKSLSECLYTNGPFGSFYVKNIASQIIHAMKYVHDQCIAHRDIKPENILFDGYTIKIIDWGLAIQLSSKDQMIGELCGTPYYMAPESLITHFDHYSKTYQNGDNYINKPDKKYHNPIISDVWQIGVTLYELVHGIIPFMATTYPKLVKLVLKKEVTFDENINPELKKMLSLMLDKNPINRIRLENINDNNLILAN